MINKQMFTSAGDNRFLKVLGLNFSNFIVKDWPDIWRVGDLITLPVSEDEGRQRHVIKVVCDPVHLLHDPVHLADIIT